MSIHTTLKSECIEPILASLEKLSTRPDPGLELWDLYLRKVRSLFQVTAGDSDDSSKEVEVPRTAHTPKEELLTLFLELGKKLGEDSAPHEFSHHLLLLHEAMGAELELSTEELMKSLKVASAPPPNKSDKKPKILEEDCVHLINRLCHRDWKGDLNKFHYRVLSEQVEAECSSREFHPEINTISSHLFAGGFMGAVLAGIHGSLGFMAPWITIPFIISGLVVTYLWVVRESKFMMAFLTSLASGILAYSFFGTTPEQGITILKVLEITSGTMMGGLVGLYHGYTRWFHIRKSLLDQFKQQRMAVLISENEPSVATLHRFCAEFVIPHFQEAKTAVASLLNEAYTSKDSCESGLRILKNQDNKPDFEEFFELHKVRNDHESRIQVLERLYGAYQKLESRLLERMKLLERASESERFQVLSGAVGNAEYLWIADQEVRGEKWKKNLARKRMDLLMTWIENFRPFLEFELHRKELNNLELWTKQIVQKSSGSVA